MELRSTIDRTKLKRRLLLGAVLFVVVTVGTVASFLYSEPYEYATHFARTDSRVIEVTGNPHKVSLRFTRPFRYSFGDRTGSASLTLKSTSIKGEFDVALELSEQAGRWTVSRADVYPEGASPVTLVNEPCPNACQ